jgi:nicotinamidase-related amidase
MSLSNDLLSQNVALLVIDKQVSYTTDNPITGRVLGNDTNPFEALIPKIDAFIERCRSKNIEIIWTQMIEDVEQSPKNIREKMQADGTPTISDPNSERFQINGLKPESGEKVIVKKYYDAFAQTDLDAYLKAKGVDTVILVGGYASRCVLGTAFGANGHDFNVIIVRDLVGVPDRFASEVPSTLSITDSILGYTPLASELNI